MPIRYYNSTHHNFKEEFEKKKYNELIRKQFIKSTLQNNPMLFSASSFKDNRKLSLKTIILLIVGSSSLTMGFYVLYQLIKFNEDEKEVDKLSRSVFLPLWVNLNYFYRPTYSFPKDLKYFDKPYAKYLDIEMDQLNLSKTTSDFDNYIELLENENIKYKALEELSLNSTVRKIFGLPLSITAVNNANFKIWIEAKHPTVSGLQLDIESIKSDNGKNKSTSMNVNWVIKSVNLKSIINNALVQAGLKLDRLDSSDAQVKTHERSSGRVHEVPITDKEKLSNLVLNKNKDYNIVFSGDLLIKDKNEFEQGTLAYKGIIDFDHLMINRGVKLIEMELIMKPKDNPNKLAKYKII